jgi:hypothetical protein
MIMVLPMNCILNFIDVGPHAHHKNTGKEIAFTLKPLTISPTSQVNNKNKR